MQWRLLGPNVCLITLFVLTAYSPPSRLNDPKSRSVDPVNPCEQSHFPMPSLSMTRTIQTHWGRYGLANCSGGMIPPTAPPFATTRSIVQIAQVVIVVIPGAEQFRAASYVAGCAPGTTTSSRRRVITAYSRTQSKEFHPCRVLQNRAPVCSTQLLSYHLPHAAQPPASTSSASPSWGHRRPTCYLSL